MHKDNKGLSLVEMLVSITIASIVSVAVFSFMIVGAKSFQKTSADVNVQHEAQLVLNQLQELLVDTNVGVEYSTDESTGDAALTMYNYDPGDADKHVYEVIYKATEKKLFYNEYNPLVSGEGASRIVSKGDAIYQDQLLGENITGYIVDLSALKKRRVVRVNLGVQRTQSEYKTSSNITLRNQITIGNTVPEYLETTAVKDPLRVEGLDNYYFEPGREVDLKSLGGYKVKMEDGSDYADQDIRFFLSDKAPVAAGTSVSTGGRLLVSKAQKQDFYVLVTSRTGKGAALEVKINMIIVDSVEITLTSYTRKDGTSGTSLTDYLFDAGDSFTLQARAIGRNLEKAGEGVDMYGISWALGQGTEKYATMGAVTKKNRLSECTFTMNSSFTLPKKQETDSFFVSATSVRSAQIPYYTGTAKTPVVGTFTAFAHAPKGDFQIKGAVNLLRGKHSSELNISLVDDIRNQIQGFDETKHRVIAKVSVNELLYLQQENSKSQVYELRKDVTDSGAYFRQEGVALGINSPSVYNSNPNITYEYEITFMIFEKRSNDYHNWGTLSIMGPGQTSFDGYRAEDAKYKSNTIVQQCERLYLFFNKIQYAVDENGKIDTRKWEGDYTTKVYPRNIFNKKGMSGNGNQYDENGQIKTEIRVYSCSNVEDNGIINAMGSNGFRMFYQKDGTWVEFDESRCIKQGGENYPKLAECITTRYENNYLVIQYRPDKWDDDVPSVVRVVPCLRYTDRDNQQKEGYLFDNYAELYLWNIEVPVVKDFQKGIKKKEYGDVVFSRLYFPCPDEPGFESLAKDGYAEWIAPYPANGTDQRQNNEISNINISYKLSYNNDGYGNPTWYLHLRYYNYDKYENIGVFICKPGEKGWTMIEQNKVPENLQFDFDK